jgi:hypothetical protein
MTFSSHNVQWIRIAAEGAAIVLSILLAFAIDAWWGTRVDREVELQALAAVRTDLLESVSELDRARRVHEARLAALETLLLVPQAGDLARDSVGALLSTSTIPTTADPQVAALSTLMSSGQMSVVSDAGLRTELAGWLAALEDHESTQVLLRDGLMERFYPWLRSRALVSSGRFGSVRHQPDYSDLFGDWRFDAELIAVAQGTAIAIAELRDLRSQTEALIQRRDEALRSAP